MSTSHRVASTDDFDGDGSRVITDIDGQEIAVFEIDGEYYAVANYCIHQGGPICEGEVSGRMTVGEDGREWKYVDDGQVINCPWHDWKFDLKSGRNVRDEQYAIPTYQVEVRDDDVYVQR